MLVSITKRYFLWSKLIIKCTSRMRYFFYEDEALTPRFIAAPGPHHDIVSLAYDLLYLIQELNEAFSVQT